jgi:hypothetical protein
MHAWGRFVTSGALCAALVVSLTAAPARADGTGDAWTDGAHIGAEAGSGGTADAATRRRGGGAETCQWSRLDDEHAATADRMSDSGWGPERGDEPGAWYRRICWTGADGVSTGTIHWVTDRVGPAVLARRAADQVRIPDPGVGVNPSPEQGAVVNVETWLWVDRSAWSPVTAEAAAGDVVVTATASPRRVVWDMGNGDRVTCEGPGTPYDASRPSSEQSTDCSYTYRKSSARAEGGAYTVTATVVWEVSWTVTGAAGGGSLGTAPRSESIRLPVKEIQAVNR